MMLSVKVVSRCRLCMRRGERKVCEEEAEAGGGD